MSTTRRVLVTTPGFEGALVNELKAITPGAPTAAFSEGAPGVVTAAEPAADAPPIDPVFARQQLPGAWEVRGPSVAALAETMYQRLENVVDGAAGPFSIHAFAPTGAAPGLASRAALIASALLALLQQRRRRAARLFRPVESSAGTFGELAVLLQILLMDRDHAWISAASPRPLERGGWELTPWPGGIAPVEEDRRPPSRAYRKLEEAFRWMGVEPQPGESCVDLGAAPGGWSYTALRRGAWVTAVDRAPLEAPVRGHPRLTMREGNAFTYQPEPAQVPVDWLLSDVICEPARALAQIQRWLDQGWCRRLVMTVKFKGQSGYGMLADVRAALDAAACPQARVKHLHHNKNEVTVMAVTAVTAVTAVWPAAKSRHPR